MCLNSQLEHVLVYLLHFNSLWGWFSVMLPGLIPPSSGYPSVLSHRNPFAIIFPQGPQAWTPVYVFVSSKHIKCIFFFDKGHWLIIIMWVVILGMWYHEVSVYFINLHFNPCLPTCWLSKCMKFMEWTNSFLIEAYALEIFHFPLNEKQQKGDNSNWHLASVFRHS